MGTGTHWTALFRNAQLDYTYRPNVWKTLAGILHKSGPTITFIFVVHAFGPTEIPVHRKFLYLSGFPEVTDGEIKMNTYEVMLWIMKC